MANEQENKADDTRTGSGSSTGQGGQH